MVEIIHEQQLDLFREPQEKIMDAFEEAKRVNSNGTEYWAARDLQDITGYAKWSNFEVAVRRTVTSLETSNVNVSDHIADAGKMVQLGSGSERQVKDYHLTRYACYLLFQNGDPSKPEIAAAQAYFNVRTREAEVRVQDVTPELTEDEIVHRAMQIQQRKIAQLTARAEQAEEVVEAVNSNRGLNCRKFHKHYFPDVPEREFFEKVYGLGLLIDQRRTRWHEKKQEWVNGYQHMHPTYTGKPYFILDGPIKGGKRREHTYVRPGKPEVELRDLLVRKGLPAPELKEIAA